MAVLPSTLYPLPSTLHPANLFTRMALFVSTCEKEQATAVMGLDYIFIAGLLKKP
jgi:hypothetical protein